MFGPPIFQYPVLPAFPKISDYTTPPPPNFFQCLVFPEIPKNVEVSVHLIFVQCPSPNFHKHNFVPGAIISFTNRVGKGFKSGSFSFVVVHKAHRFPKVVPEHKLEI